MKPLLFEGELTDVERDLLTSGRGDTPSEAARARTLAALGVGAASALGGSAVAHAAIKGAVAPAGAAVKLGGTTTALVIAKWVAVGAVAGVVTVGGVTAVSSRAPSPGAKTTTHMVTNNAAPGIAAAPRARPDDATGEFASPPPEPPAPPARSFGEPPRAESSPRTEAPAPGTAIANFGDPSPATDASGRVTEEVRSLDLVRSALAGGDARAALARLAVHGRNFPNGALEPEAVLLRVRALVRLGQRPEAERVAASFLASHPGSPQAPRLRALLGAAGGD